LILLASAFPITVSATAAVHVEGQRQAARSAVSVRDLWLTYPAQRGGEPIHLLQQVNLTVSVGELVCIVGPSGCE
jgi:ABC-type glutathione transport system ATPase component